MPTDRIAIAVALVHRDGRWLVAKRPIGVHLEGLWEFPGGKLEELETPHEAALRELHEECAVEAAVEGTLPVVSWDYGHRHVTITPVVCRWLAGEGEPLASDAVRWVATAELADLDMPAVNRTIIAQLDGHAGRQ